MNEYNDNQPQTPHHMSVEARLKRVETYLVLLCYHLGLDPKTARHAAPEFQRHRGGDQR